MLEHLFVERTLEQILIRGGAVTATGQGFLHDRSFWCGRHGWGSTTRGRHERAGKRCGGHPRAGIAEDCRETSGGERLGFGRRHVGDPQRDGVVAGHGERDMLSVGRPRHVLDAAARRNRRVDLARGTARDRLQRQARVALTARRSAGSRIESQPGQAVLERCHFSDGRQRRTFQQQQPLAVGTHLHQRRRRPVENLCDGLRWLPVLCQRGGRRERRSQRHERREGCNATRGAEEESHTVSDVQSETTTCSSTLHYRSVITKPLCALITPARRMSKPFSWQYSPICRTSINSR